MCCTEFVVKYVLFFINLVFALAGIAFIGLGVAVLIGIQDILDFIPVNINAIPISVIVFGSVVFIISFSGCWGAIKESRCLLILYAVFMLILAAAKLYLSVVILSGLSSLESTVTGWIDRAFENHGTDGAFGVMEVAFRCCGSSGADSYASIGVIPPTCCASPVNNQCTAADSYSGCSDQVSSYFEIFGEAIGITLIIIIAFELVAMVFALYLNNTVTNKNRANRLQRV